MLASAALGLGLFYKLSPKRDIILFEKGDSYLKLWKKVDSCQNKGLTEILDGEILEFLKYEYKKNYTIYRTDTPLICGTLVNRNRYQNIFDRKLKMLRTPIFSMLSII